MEVAFPLLGKSGPTCFVPREQDWCAQWEGRCERNPARAAQEDHCFPDGRTEGGHSGPPPASPTALHRGLSPIAQGSWARVWGWGWVWSQMLLGHCVPSWASHSFPLCYPWSPRVMGSLGAGVGRCWVHKHQTAIRWLVNKGSPQQDSIRVPKTRLGPPECAPPSCWQLLIYAKQMYENPKSPVGPGGQGRIQLAEPALKGSCVPLAA